MIRVRGITRMEASSPEIFNPPPPPASTSNRYPIPSASYILQPPLSLLLEYFGILRSGSNHRQTDSFIDYRLSSGFRAPLRSRTEENSAIPNDGEVSISILGSGERHPDGEGQVREVLSQNEVSLSPESMAGMASATLAPPSDNQERSGNGRIEGEGDSQSVNATSGAEAGDGVGANVRDPSYQRYDIQQAARWIEQVLPFSLLLLVVFIRQHLQGTFSILNFILLSSTWTLALVLEQLVTLISMNSAILKFQ